MTTPTMPPATPRTATIFTDPASARPPLWTAPLRALWPMVVSILIAAVVFFFVLPHLNGYQQLNIFNCAIAVILAVSLAVVNGFTGQFSIGHSGFMALGGFAAASLMYYGSYRWFGDTEFHGGRLSWTLKQSEFTGRWLASGDWLFLLSLLFGAVVAAMIGWVVGLPSLRLRGDYLAIVTLGFCEIVRVIIQSTAARIDIRPTDPDDVDTSVKYLGDQSLMREMTHLGGPVGFSGAPKYSSIFWVMIAVLITLALTIRLKFSSYGRAMLSIREDEIAAQAVGVNMTRLKVRAFVFSAFFAGLAGGLYALRNGTISPGEMGFQRSFDFVIMVVLGGLGSISGATIAAIFLTMLQELLRDPPSLGLWGWSIVMLIAAGIAIFAPAKKKLGPIVTLIGICVGWEIIRAAAKHFGVDLSDYRLVIYSLLLIATMILRPQGLFGVHEIWDYLPAKWQFWNRAA
jgi:branched-chain amino acid transport system permease protein